MKNNYIESLHVVDMGLFKQLDMEFNDKFNFVVGPNGCGKTSILRCLSIALSPHKAKEFRHKENSAVWIDCVCNDTLIRVGLGKGWVRNGEDYRHAILSNWTIPPVSDGRESMNINQLMQKNLNFTPLILGAYRRIEYKEIHGMAKEKNIRDRRKQFYNESLSNIDGGSMPEVKQWLINRYFQMEKPWAKQLKINWDWLVERLELIGPKNSGFKFKEIRQDLEPIFECYDQECYLEELSAGFQAILSLILSIFDWVESTNEEPDIIVKSATGTVIIDELDVHLHPEWQLTIRETLENIFPYLQFIITTHSPHLIASVKTGELIILKEHDGIVNVKPIDKSYSGWNTDQILEEVMGVKSLENKRYSLLIEDAMQLVENKNIDGLKKAIQELENVVHPSDTIVSVLKIKVAALELGE
ncbi:MAG: hypothetical protein FH756_17615 [Firmicutes bacterium]|nr:hypothetical protein [Bacillota bacterium]